MRILIASFKQETNTFSPILCDLSYFRSFLCLEKNEIIETFAGGDDEISGMLDSIQAHGDTPVPAVVMRARSNGRVDQSVADLFLKKTISIIDEEKPDAIFLAMHGGMAFNHGIDDGTGYIYRRIREHVGSEIIIAASHDMHSNITKENISDVDMIAGYHTYPHIDLKSTGYRAAELGYRLINKKPAVMSCVRIPMIVPAEGYTSQSGVFKELTARAELLEKEHKILDFSIFQMQPWLNVQEASSAVIVVAETLEASQKYAKMLAHDLFDIRKDMSVELYDIEDVIDKAVHNQTKMPVILVDSADSPGAGSCADSSFVLEHLLKRNTDLRCAIYISDGRAADHAFEVGVGNTGTFELGGTLDPAFQKTITVQATVRSLHDGLYYCGNPSISNFLTDAGKSAVLRIRNIDVVVMHILSHSADVQTYRAFGVDPAVYDLVDVKSANQYKLMYSEFTNLFFPTDTPGSSTANLKSLPFDRIPRPFYPFDDITDFDDTPV